MGLFRILMFAGVALLALVNFKRVTGGIRGSRQDLEEDERLGRLVQDPECGVYVDSKEAVRRKAPDGELFFCSEKCAKAHFAQAQPGE